MSFQIAAKVLLDESIKCIEQEMAAIDEEERIDRPPKKILTAATAAGNSADEAPHSG